MSKHSIKEVIKEMCKALPGGRSAMAGALGMSLDTFNNKLYEKNGCRFFDIDEQEAMKDISGTKLLVEYHLDRHGMSPRTLRAQWDDLTLRLAGKKKITIDSVERDETFRLIWGTGYPN